MIVKKLIIHHSESPKDTTTKAKILEWHVKKKKPFSTIGYHKVIEIAGKISDGRSEGVQGAHALGANSHSLGICVCGNFDKEIPGTLQIKSLVKVLVSWCKEHDLSEKSIYGHCKTPGVITTKTCPGKNLKVHIIRNRVKEELERVS